MTKCFLVQLVQKNATNSLLDVTNLAKSRPDTLLGHIIL